MGIPENGMMENWNVGKKHEILLLDSPEFLNSNIPAFHYSMIISPNCFKRLSHRQTPQQSYV
jgi:hypothetical protein